VRILVMTMDDADDEEDKEDIAEQGEPEFSR
jgi:hypothetical protein